MRVLSLLGHGWRSWKSPKSVLLLAIVALAVGIGSTAAIYTVIHAVLLRPLPYEHADRWVSIFGARFSEPNLRSATSQPDLSDFTLTSPGQPQRILGVEVTPSLIESLGVNPARRRWFHESVKEQGGVYLAVNFTAAAPAIFVTRVTGICRRLNWSHGCCRS